MLFLLACSDYVLEEKKPDNESGAPDIAVSPESVDFGLLGEGESATETLEISNLGDTLLSLDEVVVVGGTSFSLVSLGSTMLDPGSSTTVVLSYYPGAPTESSTLSITSNDPDEPQVLVPLTGQGEIAILSVTPASVDFGTISVGAQVSEEIVLENIGSAALTVDSYLLSGDFTIDGDPAPLKLEPGDSTTLDLSFSAAVIGEYSGQLWVQDSTAVGTTIVPVYARVSEAPVAVCSVDPPEIAALYESATWMGEESYDPNGESIISYNWTLTSAPAGSGASLPFGNANLSGFVADMVGTYEARLTVTNDAGMESEPCYATLEAVPAQNLWIELYWDHDDDDMDLHLVQPGGNLETSSDCYYANCVGGGLDWGVVGSNWDDPRLDLDDIWGTGPENINIFDPEEGTFYVYVHDYPYTGKYSGDNNVTVKIYVAGALAWTGTRTIDGENSYTAFATVSWPDGAVVGL